MIIHAARYSMHTWNSSIILHDDVSLVHLITDDETARQYSAHCVSAHESVNDFNLPVARLAKLCVLLTADLHSSLLSQTLRPHHFQMYCR